VSVSVISGGLTAGNATISGDAVVGATLTAHPGSWNPDGVTLAYQWMRDGDPISGATATTYQLVPADLGLAISVAVTGSYDGFDDVTTTSSATDPVVAATLTVGTPDISGATMVGKTLTGTAGTWTSGTDFAYQWLRNGKAISGATSTTYHVVAADLGDRLSLQVTGSLAGYTTATANSAQTAAVAHGSLGTVSVSTSGTPKFHDTLTARASYGSVSGVKANYQWFRGNASIARATGKSYRLVGADVGRRISVMLTVTAPGYNAVTAWSRSASVPKDHVLFVLAVPHRLTAGSARKVTVTLSAGPSGNKPTGRVTVYYGSKHVSVKVNSHAQKKFTITVPKLKKGTYKIHAKYSGSTAYLTKITKTHTIHVN
jgi:hypothetical protein